MPMTNGLLGALAGVPESEYHADRSSLSSSGARTLLQSPAKFKWAQDHPKRATYFDVGSYVHALVLGEGAGVHVIDADDYRGKAAREARDQAYADGLTPLLRADHELAQRMCESVNAHPLAATLLSEGEPELSLYWIDPETGIKLRARLDWFRPVDGADPVVVDLKTTAASASPEAFAASAAKYKYHFQAAWYLEGMRQTGLADNADFLFVTVEKEAPHLVSVTQLCADALALGERQMREAVRIYAACLETDTWPGYGDDVTVIDLPRWAYSQ